MISREELLSASCTIMGEEVCSEIQEWYRQMTMSNARYVVYIVRRCYMLALLMEHITGVNMKDNGEREFLTDASFFLRCDELADYYRKYNQFPRILLCDDILIHGRNINHFLKMLEDRLCELLPEYEEGEIQTALVAAMKIHVYVRSDMPLLLLGRYELSLEYCRKEDASFWRRVSSNISTLILRADMANACYIFSESVPQTIYHEIVKKDEWYKTVFQNTIQYAYVDYLKDNDLLKAIYTIRIVKAQRSDDYRAIPFVFLPNLSGEETDAMKNAIFDKLRYCEKWRNIEKYIDSLSEINGKRLFNEWFTLLISQTLLNHFNSKFDLKIDFEGQEYLSERAKLIRNYNAYEEDITSEILDFTLQQDVLTIDDLNDIFRTCIGEHFIMEMSSFKQDDEGVNKALIRERMEDYFYQNGIMEEISAYELTQISYVPTKRRHMRRVRGCGFTLAALAESSGVLSKAKLDCIMAYFLQMMDAGVLALSSYSSRETKVVGYAQFAKAGEQSLQLYPLRFYEYIPLLVRIYRRCMLNRIDFKNEIEMFFLSRYCEIEEVKKKAILDFVSNMLSVGQTPYDWNGNYLMKIDLERKNGETSKIDGLFRYMHKQGAHIISYEDYTEGK